MVKVDYLPPSSHRIYAYKNTRKPVQCPERLPRCVGNRTKSLNTNTRVP